VCTNSKKTNEIKIKIFWIFNCIYCYYAVYCIRYYKDNTILWIYIIYTSIFDLLLKLIIDNNNKWWIEYRIHIIEKINKL